MITLPVYDDSVTVRSLRFVKTGIALFIFRPPFEQPRSREFRQYIILMRSSCFSFFTIVLVFIYWTKIFARFSKVQYLLKTCRTFPSGFERPIREDGSLLLKCPRKPKHIIPIRSVEELKEVFKQGYRVQDMDVRGDIAGLLKDNSIHPVVQALYDRKRHNSKPGERGTNDTAKVAIAIEGGGMRGCVAAGMISVSLNSLRQ